MKKTILSLLFVCGLAYSSSAYILLWGHYKSTGPNSFTCRVSPALCAVVQVPAPEPEDPYPWLGITVYTPGGDIADRFDVKSYKISRDSDGSSHVTYELP